MTKLLVSVRSPEEASIACHAKISILDIKEPNHGSLGRTDAATIDAILSKVPAGVPTSVALGELIDNPERLTAAQLSRIRFVKVGLAGMTVADPSHWKRKWQRWMNSYGQTIVPVAVAYADWRQAKAPQPIEILNYAAQCNCEWFLIDTHEKGSYNLISIFGLQQMNALVNEAQERGIKIAIAGSLSAREICQLLPFRPDVIAVRGAVCRSGRKSMIDLQKTKDLVTIVTKQ